MKHHIAPLYIWNCIRFILAREKKTMFRPYANNKLIKTYEGYINYFGVYICNYVYTGFLNLVDLATRSSSINIWQTLSLDKPIYFLF